MKNTELQIKNALQELLNSGQTRKEMQENLHFLLTDWYHPNKEEHQITIFSYNQFKYLLSIDSDNISKSLGIIECWFSHHPEDGINRFIDHFHNMKTNFLKTRANIGYYEEKEMLSLFETYEQCRSFFLKLKMIEPIFIKEWESKHKSNPQLN